MSIRNPTMDPETFARQFARIKARDADQAPRLQNAPISAETAASCAAQEDPDTARLRRFRALLGSVAG